MFTTGVPALRPKCEGDDAGVLLALDVDGVLSPFEDEWMPVRKPVRTQHGRTYWMGYHPEVIESLDDIVRTYGVRIGWSTTWGPNVEHLINQAFDGLLAGGFILVRKPKRHRGHLPADWKAVGVAAQVHRTGQPWVWADDEAIGMARLDGSFNNDAYFGTAPHLLLETAPTVGLTLEHLNQFRAFCENTTRN